MSDKCSGCSIAAARGDFGGSCEECKRDLNFRDDVGSELATLRAEVERLTGLVARLDQEAANLSVERARLTREKSEILEGRIAAETSICRERARAEKAEADLRDIATHLGADADTLLTGLNGRASITRIKANRYDEAFDRALAYRTALLASNRDRRKSYDVWLAEFGAHQRAEARADALAHDYAVAVEVRLRLESRVSALEAGLRGLGKEKQIAGQLCYCRTAADCYCVAQPQCVAARALLSPAPAPDPKKPTIAELEAILAGERTAIVTLSNVEIRAAAPVPDPRDERIARLVGALRGVMRYGAHDPDASAAARAALDGEPAKEPEPREPCFGCSEGVLSSKLGGMCGDTPDADAPHPEINCPNRAGEPKWTPPVACAKCQTPIRKFATGDEKPCRECDGSLCERCCDARRAGEPEGKEVPRG
jgi:hypothetical protein